MKGHFLTSVTAFFERLIFVRRAGFLSIFFLLTCFMFYCALQIRADASFMKWLPLEHEYISTFLKHEKQFGGANRIIITLTQKEGDIFHEEFFDTLRKITDDVFFIPGVDRTSVKSIFTPNVRFVECIEGGFTGGNIIPNDFLPTPEMFEKVKENISKSNYIGRLVSGDFTGAMVFAELQEINPETGERLNYADVANQLEEIRNKYEMPGTAISVIGFAKLIGDIADGVAEVVMFFLVTLLVTAILLYFYSNSLQLTLLPIASSLVAVVWQLGLLHLLGYGIDPMSVLLPFLIFAIGISHGIQVINSIKLTTKAGHHRYKAAVMTFHRLLLPGSVALISDSIGFLTAMLIDIEVIREMTVTASIGVAVIILTNLFVLPVLMSYVHIDQVPSFRCDTFWRRLSRFAEPKFARITLVAALLIAVAGAWKAQDMKIGDLRAGAPEVKVDSRFNKDIALIAEKFSVGVDVISNIAEAYPGACTDYEVMKLIDDFTWKIQNVEGVRSVTSLPGVTRVLFSAWNEGSLKWQTLPRNKYSLAQSMAGIHTASGLLDFDCAVMPIVINPVDHKAETINRITKEIKLFNEANSNDKVTFRLASGNVGVMAATNETVEKAQIPMLLYVYCAIMVLCLISFRTIAGSLCIILPLVLVSTLAYAMMAMMDIGLKVATLPVAALGVGIGIDYGIYIFHRLQQCLEKGMSLKDAYEITLRERGNAVLFTGLTLAIGVSSWMFSDLQFQADMGALLTFMFLVNMLGAVILLPALAVYLLPKKPTKVR